MKKEQIRPIALGIIWRGDELLVFEAKDPTKNETFYRPLGGGIAFGEPSLEALRREFREELDAELVDVRYLTTLENIFTFNGQRGHEIVLLYEATFSDPSLYEQEHFEIDEGDEIILPARWMPLSEFRSGDPPLYPDNLLDYLDKVDEAAEKCDKI